MNTTPLAPIVRWTASAACVAFVLWGLPGCDDGHDDDHGEAATSHSSAGEADDHDDGGHDDHSDDDHHDGDHDHAVEFTAPQSFSDAVEMIHAQLQKIENLIATRELNHIHAEAAVIRDVADGIGRLALKEGSGVPREAVREINLAAKDLAAKFGPIDQAGDSGDLSGTQAVYEEMVALFETIEKYAQDHDDDSP